MSQHDSAARSGFPVQVVTDMAKRLAQGPKPEWLFLCRVSNGLLACKVSAEDKIVLLFMTPFAAMDYITATKTAVEVQQLKFEAVPELAGRWLAAGVAGLTLNRGPRYPTVLATPLDAVADMHTFAMAWGSAGRRSSTSVSGRCIRLEPCKPALSSRSNHRVLAIVQAC